MKTLHGDHETPGGRCRSMMLATALLALAGPALALGVCSAATSGLAFGPYQPLTFAGKLISVDVTSTATITVQCTGLLDFGGYSLSLGRSSRGGGDRISTRYLSNITNRGDPMAFNIYTDSGYVTVWGDGTTGSRIFGSAPLILGTSTQTHTVYGKVPAMQNTLRAGSFSDTMTITLTFDILL